MVVLLNCVVVVVVVDGGVTSETFSSSLFKLIVQTFKRVTIECDFAIRSSQRVFSHANVVHEVFRTNIFDFQLHVDFVAIGMRYGFVFFT